MGLDRDEVVELTARVHQVLTGRAGFGRGRPPAVGLFQAVRAVLVLARQNLPQAVVADLLGVSQSTVSRLWRRLMPVLGQVTCLHRPPWDDAVKNRTVLLDGTLVPTWEWENRPKDYSGKHRRAGMSIQVLSDLDGQLLAISPALPGCTHDRTALRDTGWETLLTGTDTLGDKAYHSTLVITPTRIPYHGALSPSDKEHNKHHSALRAAVERCIAHLKNWKILSTGYRGRPTELPDIIRIITNLEFYRLGW